RDVLAALDVMDSEPDPDFDRLTRIAARLFGTEFAQVTLVDADRQWYRSCFGMDGLTETSLDVSFCAHTIAALDSDHLVVGDLTQDERFKANPFVTGQPGVRFYAGAPVTVRGQRIGTLCVLGTEARSHVDPDLIAQLIDMADVASTLFSLKDEARVRARTAAALIKEEWRHALTLEAGKVGSWVWDIRTGEVSCNDTFRRMYDLPETEPIQFEQILEAHDPRDRHIVEEGLAASFADGLDYNAEARVGANARWLTMRGRVYQRDAEGKPLIMMGASLDISESKQSAEQTRLLLRELNHRVKNTLAMIQSVARQTIKKNPDPKQFIEAFSGRLRTISDAHVLLADRDWSGVQLYEVLGSQLGENFIQAPDRVEVAGEDVTLPADHALGLGLILHELTTNAHRYGAWSNERGIVAINWDVLNSPVRGLSMRWRERGGPPALTPSETGLGVRLIERSLAKVLDSEVKLRFEPGGVAADIWMPLPLYEG
ncbi:MAG TPA: HWE histidine kinase domain-containing protein, partial [Devosia sp.]|nr:HWE histidine kinase domain-containing protein [Devosia sp.]